MKARDLQFSVRGLLVLTSVVAVFLLLAARFSELLALFALAGGVLTIVLIEGPLGLLSWMPFERGSKSARTYWTVVGSLFALVAGLLAWLMVFDQVHNGLVIWLLVAFYLFVAGMCYRTVWRSYARADS